jgi:carbonic anhydrase
VNLNDLETPSSDYNPADFEAHPEEHPEEVVNNGHTIQVDFDDGDSLTIGEARFQLVQLHFHAPSEHTVAGRGLPMEVHLVHRSDAGVLAVVGVLIAEGRHNPNYEPIWGHLPEEAGAHASLADLTLDLEDLLPKRRLAFRYMGSLTTPPCSEGVRWFVLADPIELSADQIAEFTEIYDHNSRPTQPLHGRSLVLEKLD